MWSWSLLGHPGKFLVLVAGQDAGLCSAMHGSKARFCRAPANNAQHRSNEWEPARFTTSGPRTPPKARLLKINASLYSVIAKDVVGSLSQNSAVQCSAGQARHGHGHGRTAIEHEATVTTAPELSSLTRSPTLFFEYSEISRHLTDKKE